MTERVALNVRLPAELHEALKKLADSDDRSLNAYIVRALKEHVEKTGKPK